jgi:hypothetical protein
VPPRRVANRVASRSAAVAEAFGPYARTCRANGSLDRTRSAAFRAYKAPELRGYGTPELQARRHALVNGADPQLAATASGILLANEFLSPEPHAAAMVYARLPALLSGKAWPHACPLVRALGDQGSVPPEELLERAKERPEQTNARLSPVKRQAVANVAVRGFIPQLFPAKRLNPRRCRQTSTSAWRQSAGSRHWRNRATLLVQRHVDVDGRRVQLFQDVLRQTARGRAPLICDPRRT